MVMPVCQGWFGLRWMFVDSTCSWLQSLEYSDCSEYSPKAENFESHLQLPRCRSESGIEMLSDCLEPQYGLVPHMDHGSERPSESSQIPPAELSFAQENPVLGAGSK